METCFNYVSKETAYFSSDERKWINRIKRLKERYPEQITIMAEPEKNDGSIYCTIPSDWLKIAPKRKIEMTEEQREAHKKLFLENIGQNRPKNASDCSDDK